MLKLLVVFKNIFNFFLGGIFASVLIVLRDTSLATISMCRLRKDFSVLLAELFPVGKRVPI